MKLGKLLEDAEIVSARGADPELEISGIAAHTDKVKEGSLFICIKGKNGNGHEHICDAIKRGAAVIVTEEEPPDDCRRYVRVPSARSFWAAAENAAAGRPADRLRLIAVTGTNGKSSVTRMLRSIIEAGGERCGEIGTLTGTMTTPDPDVLYPLLAAMERDGCKSAVMEASSHALALDKLAPIRYAGAVFTNLTLDHTDFHGSMEAYGAAKAKLFGMCEKALVCLDDPGMKALSEAKKDGRYFYSMESDAADFTARGLKCTTGGFRYDLLENGRLYRITSPLIGRFHAQNSLAAAGMARLIGIDPCAVKRGIASVGTIDGRMMPVPVKGSKLRAFIDYAHTPDALRVACLSLRECMKPDERLTVIFGCGGDRDRTKRPVMGKVAAQYADKSIITADNSRSEDTYEIIREIVSGMPPYARKVSIADRRQAIAYAVHTALKNDVLLFCGKGHEKYEINADGSHPFDEADEIRKAAASR
ncbi:MAG: UDP-N-acetylmuramoyl-L-alanyl-D-glutamate--2,6-diaminopimelate ligase [Clostridia bacterium]|nr:UDP-N-acetylmuramoyl-L-alanyl-D-glutamate--2,6-diaminopimelate ligase [Clostridia bacterium]